ncbi:MAG: hypothetical protein RIQ90_1136 [Bacteroidota bacterium]|jgi:hypothetical protein
MKYNFFEESTAAIATIYVIALLSIISLILVFG